LIGKKNFKKKYRFSASPDRGALFDFGKKMLRFFKIFLVEKT